MTSTDDLRQRLLALAGDIEQWRSESRRLREVSQLPGAAADDALLLSIEETSGAIYRGIAAFDELVVDVEGQSHAAAGQVAEVGDALRLVLMEITELGTGLYSLRSSEESEDGLIEFATSSNGDKWFLSSAEDDGQAFVEHHPNEPSGGAITRTSVTEFLAGKPSGPQHEALRRWLEAGRHREGKSAQSSRTSPAE